MDKEIDDNIKPVKTCCGGRPLPQPDPNCCRIVCSNTFPFGTTRKSWRELSKKSKHAIAIANDWKTYDCEQVRDVQPKYKDNAPLPFRPN